MKKINPYGKTKWLHIRLTPAEHKIIIKNKEKSTCRNMSQYIRNMVFDRPIVATYRNLSQDDLIQEIAVLNQELNAIGNNLNQVTKKLHTIHPSEELFWGSQFSSQAEVILSKIAVLKETMQNIAERWLR